MTFRDLVTAARREASPLATKALGTVRGSSLFSLRHGRLRLLLAQKLIHLFFKLRNRLETRGIHHLRRLMARGEPFLVVANHAGNADVMMHQALHAHHDNLVFTFTDSGGMYRPDVPVLTTLLHFAEIIPRHGPGQKSVDRMVGRLARGDNVLLFPEGSFDFGLVMEGFTGVARVAREYLKRTGKLLWILPSCSIGMHEAYNPHVWWLRHIRKGKPVGKKKQKAAWLPRYAHVDRPHQKVIVKFGAPFTLRFSPDPTKQDYVDATSEVMHRIAGLWGQKRIRPSHSRARVIQANPATNNTRVYVV